MDSINKKILNACPCTVFTQSTLIRFVVMITEHTHFKNKSKNAFTHCIFVIEIHLFSKNGVVWLKLSMIVLFKEYNYQ